MQDTQDFYARWYVPNNVTITITGDFDLDEAKTYVNKYFGEIPKGEKIEPYGARPGKLSETIKLVPVSYTHLRAPRDLSTSRMPSSA